MVNPGQSKPISLCDQNNSPIPKHDIPQTLNSSFCFVFTQEPAGDLPEFPYSDHPAMRDIVFNSNGVLKAIEALKLRSSAGVDGINSKILKNTKSATSVLLSHIFQQSLSSGVVPLDWKVGKIVPIPKKGPPTSSSSYRPISITSVSSKLMKHIIYSHVINFLVSVNFFHPSQHGFLKGFSCETQLALFTNDLSSSADHN
ncbi:uncharacterized protein LOC120840415, partial [Ixodes scapularis]|uniref:uncharacterized protein LOC120840415 n=1 Tax=Ixodes scapularis TaxID=6945 RepID=UPI001A9FA802